MTAIGAFQNDALALKNTRRTWRTAPEEFILFDGVFRFVFSALDSDLIAYRETMGAL